MAEDAVPDLLGELCLQLGITRRDAGPWGLVVSLDDARRITGEMRARGLRTYGLVVFSAQGERITGAFPPLKASSTPDDEASWMEAELDEIARRTPEALVRLNATESKWRQEVLLRIAAAREVPVAGSWAIPLVPAASAATIVDHLEAEGLPLRGIEVFSVRPDGIQPDGWPIDIPNDAKCFDTARALLRDLEPDRWVYLDLATRAE